MMERIAVKSSALAAIGYDPNGELLEVVFQPNQLGICHVWRYHPVPQSTVDEMLAEGASVGSIFHAKVRKNDHISAEKVNEEPFDETVPA